MKIYIGIENTMSFKEEHPKYRTYTSDLPYNFKWSELESLVAEAGGSEREFLVRIVQKIAIKTRAGSVSGGNPYDWIEYVVAKIRERVIQIIINTGDEVRGAKVFITELGAAEASVRLALQNAIDSGTIEVSGVGKNRIYRLSKGKMIDQLVVDKDDVLICLLCGRA